jgi:hypothetical protein
VDTGSQILADRAQSLNQQLSYLLVDYIQYTIRILRMGKCCVDKEFQETMDIPSDYENVKNEMPFLYKLVSYTNIVVRYLFNDFDGCTNQIKAYHSLAHKEDMSPVLTSTLTFVEALIQIATARKKRRMYSCRASYCSYILHKYSKGEPYTHRGRYVLIEAELSDLYGYSFDHTYPKYVTAVALAAKSESLLTVAITNEVTAKYIIRNQKKNSALPSQDAMRYFNEALTTYKQWGAMAKVRHLEQEMNEYGYAI